MVFLIWDFWFRHITRFLGHNNENYSPQVTFVVVIELKNNLKVGYS